MTRVEFPLRRLSFLARLGLVPPRPLMVKHRAYVHDGKRYHEWRIGRSGVLQFLCFYELADREHRAYFAAQLRLLRKVAPQQLRAAA